MTPEFITFTGLDERTDMQRVSDLSRHYPLEWGVLFSERNTGRSPRYPGLLAVDGFRRHTNLRLSAHLCGAWSRRAVQNNVMPGELRHLKGVFDRVQFNLRDGETDIRARPDPARLAAHARSFGASGAILQCRGPEFPRDTTVDWLFDESGGAGVGPKRWPIVHADASADLRVGYAGGIGPENVGLVLAAIAESHPADRFFWIDMESRVRTNEWLDLDKCEAVCRSVYGE